MPRCQEPILEAEPPSHDLGELGDLLGMARLAELAAADDDVPPAAEEKLGDSLFSWSDIVKRSKVNGFSS